MVNRMAVIKGHRLAAIEHVAKYHMDHKPTWMQAILDTLHELICYKTITIGDAYVVYEVIRKRTLGQRMALVTSLYVPEEERGNGIGSKLLDLIPEELVISDRGRHEEVGRLVVCRRYI